MMIDLHPEASIYSHDPSGRGRDELKWNSGKLTTGHLRGIHISRAPYTFGVLTDVKARAKSKR